MQNINLDTGKANGNGKRSRPAPAKLPAVAQPKPAHAEKARLAELRAANGGFIVPRPDEHLFAVAGPAPSKTESATVQNTPNGAMRQILDWFQAILDAGGTVGDLQLAWHSWQHCRQGAKEWARVRQREDQARQAYVKAKDERVKFEASLARLATEN